MATIVEVEGKGGIRYKAVIRLKGHPTQSKTFERKTDAKLWAQRMEADIRRGRNVDTSEARRRTLGELIDRYAATVLPMKPKSEKKQASQLAWWKEQFGTLVLTQVTPQMLAEARDRLGSEITVRGTKRAPATVVRYMAVMSHALSISVKEWGWLAVNPMARVRKPTEPRGRVRWLEREELDRLLSACKESRSRLLYPVVMVAVSTGMRQGEILGLHWRDIDLKKGSITLHDTKNGDRRAVPVRGQALEVMRELAKVRRLDTTLVFPGRPRRDGEVKPASLKTAWDRAIERADIDNFRFHDLRHTTASYLAMNGATLTEIAAVLGHKTLAMVKRYTHLSDSHTASVVERMNERFLGGV